MKLHLPKALLAATLAASGIVGSHALAVATGTYTAVCPQNGDATFLHNYTFTNEATQERADWDVAAANDSEAILHFTAGSCTTANTVAKVQYSTFSAGGFTVDSDTNVAGIGVDGSRNFVLGHANKTSSSQINRNFTLKPNNGLALAGTQTWTVATGATFSLEDSADQKTHGVSLNGSLTLNGSGNVDFTSQTLSGSANSSVTVSSGTLKRATVNDIGVTVDGGTLNTVTMNRGVLTVNGGTLNTVTIADGATLKLGTNGTLSGSTMSRGVTMSSGSLLDLTGRTASADTPMVSSKAVTISEGTTISLSGVTEGSTVKISDTTLNGVNFIIDGEKVVAARSTITQESGTYTFETLGRVYSDMVWAGGVSGTWNTTDANWTSQASGSADSIAFANDDSVTFQTSAAVTVAEGVTVGGMSVTGAGTILDLAVSNNGYVRGDVTVSNGAKLVLKTQTDEVGLIRGDITVSADSTLRFDAKDVTGWDGNANATQSITIEKGAQLLLHHTQNETFRGLLTLNGTLKGDSDDGGSAQWDFYGGSASLVVEEGETTAKTTAKVENVTLRLRQANSQITVNQNATLTVGSIIKHGDVSGIFNKLGSGAMNVTGNASIGGFSLNGGDLTFSGGGSLGSISLTAGGTNLTFSVITGTTETTYTAGAISVGTNDNRNHFDRDMTIDQGVTVNATGLSNNWGMGVVTVNGLLNLSGELRLYSGGNSGNLTNVINGSGSVVAATFTAANEGTYTLGVANFTATTSNIARATTITNGNVNLGTLTLGARLQVNNGAVTIASASGNGTLAANAGTITLGVGSHSFSTIDLSNGGASTAKMTVQAEGRLTAATLWGCANSSILLEKDATFTSGAVEFKGVAATTEADKTKVQAGSNARYSLEAGNYTISNATVTVNSADATTIGNILSGGSLINAGAGEVTTTSGWNNLTKIEAKGGNINVQWFDNQGDLHTLVIAEGKTVAAHTRNDALTSTENEATLVVTGVATFGQGATLNANLKLKSSVTLTLNGTLQMGSTLTLNQGMTLDGGLLAALNRLGVGETVDLFTGVDTLTLGDVSYTMGTDTLSKANGIDLNTYFSNVQAGNYVLGYNEVGTVYAESLVPEPSTATLGLLALAALCARRRRK